MMIKQGEIYLVNFGKKHNSELGKIRPAVVLQHNFLNKILDESLYKSVIVIPLSTKDIQTEYKIKIGKRDKLKHDSFIITTWVCTVDVDRFDLKSGVMARLNEVEIKELKNKFCKMI